MVRSSQAEDSVSAYFDLLVKNRSQAEVGLLVGKPSVGSRDLIFDVIKTPSPEGEAVLSVTTADAAGPGKKGSKSKVTASMELDEGWVVTHAENVNRMLPGGIGLLGVYLFVPDAALQASTSQVWNILNQIHEINSDAASSAPQPPLLLHADSTTRKVSLKEMNLASPGSLKPCDIKFGPTLSNLIWMSCRYHVNLTTPSFSRLNPSTLKDQVSALVEAESQHIQAALPAINGMLPQTDQTISDFLPSASITQPTHIELLHTPYSSLHAPTASSSQVDGCSFLHGWVEGHAYLHKRETVAKAISEIKADLQRSLRFRLDLILEEASSMDSDLPAGEDDPPAADSATTTSNPPPASGAAAGDAAHRHPLLRQWQWSQGFSQPLPRRVMVPWKSEVKFSDYLMEAEGVEAVVERAAEVLHLELDGTSAVVEPEGAAKGPGQSVWSVGSQGVDGVAAGRGGAAQAWGSACSGPVLAAVAAAAAALAAAAVTLSGQAS